MNSHANSGTQYFQKHCNEKNTYKGRSKNDMKLINKKPSTKRRAFFCLNSEKESSGRRTMPVLLQSREHTSKNIIRKEAISILPSGACKTLEKQGFSPS